MIRTKREAEAIFKSEILPTIRETYERNGARDIPARSEAWNDWTDAMIRDGEMTHRAYDWVHPTCCND